MQREDILDYKQEILNLVAAGKPLYFIAKFLSCKQSTLTKYLKIMNINYKGTQGKRLGEKTQNNVHYIPFQEYIKPGRSHSTVVIKNKLFLEGYKEKKCEKCGLSQWLGGEIPLELHHIDGNPNNNDLLNLQILCPNCHSLTENFCGKNIKNIDSPIKIKKRLHKEACQAQGQIDSLGRATVAKLSNNELENRKQLILNSGVSLNKYGWQKKVSAVTGLSCRQISKIINIFSQEFDGIIYRRNLRSGDGKGIHG